MGYRTYTCPVARACGGCTWLAVPYPIQLRRKQEFVIEQLGTLVEADGGTVAPIRGMDEPKAYRHKCASPFAPGKGGHLRCGFYAAGTHRIVTCKRCLVEHPLGRPIINAVAAHAARLGIPAYHEDSATGCLRHAVVRVSHATGKALLTLVSPRRNLTGSHALATSLMGEFSQLVGVIHNVNATRGNAILGRENHTLAGSAVLHDTLLGCTFEIGATTFYQTNPTQTEVLYRIALDGAGLDAPQRHAPTHLLDAYCGCGTIGICAATRAARHGMSMRVTGIERVAGAVIAARHNAVASGVSERCTFTRGDATVYLRELASSGSSTDTPDTVVMDPPRAGSTPAFIDAVCALAPKRVVYVSCNVVTQARDLARLRDGGYRIATVTPVDLFPHTKHVETVAVLVHR